jgi:hypothetical protein
MEAAQRDECGMSVILDVVGAPKMYLFIHVTGSPFT